MKPTRVITVCLLGDLWFSGARAVAANVPLSAPAGSTSEAADDIRAIRPPVPIPNAWVWFWSGLALSLLAAALFVWWRRWQRRRLLPAPIVVVPPHVRAKQRLEAALFHITEPNRFCTQVADTIRVYLEERFQLRAPERTTEEFLLELQSSRHLLPDQKVSLAEFLQHCDLVKFARFEPTETALRTLYDAAVRLVDETQFAPLEPGGTTGSNASGPKTPHHSPIEPPRQAPAAPPPPLAGHSS
jgi:hypothetical protein